MPGIDHFCHPSESLFGSCLAAKLAKADSLAVLEINLECYANHSRLSGWSSDVWEHGSIAVNSELVSI